MKIGKKSVILAFLATALLQGSIIYRYSSSLIAHKPKKEAEKPLYLIHPQSHTTSLSQPLWQQLYQLAFDEKNQQLSINELQKMGIFSQLVKEQDEDKVELRYSLREPKAILGDYSNSLVAKDGAIMAFAPYYTERSLPVIYFGPFLRQNESIWNKRLDDRFWQSVCCLLDHLEVAASRCLCRLDTVDLSRMIAGAQSTSEIVVTLTSDQEMFQGKKCHIRIGLQVLQGCNQQKNNLFKQIEQLPFLSSQVERLWQQKKEAVAIVDMRINGVAFIGY